MVRNPAVFLLDEPLSNLDAKLRTSMRTEIIKLHKKLATTFIYVTHDQTEAMTMGDRIVVMKDGIIQQVDTPQNLYDMPATSSLPASSAAPQMNGAGRWEVGPRGDAFSLKVVNVEDLGSDGYIYGNIITDGSAAEASQVMSDQNKLTTIRVNPRALPKVGATVKIKIDPAKMHLFAPSTELRLN